MDAQLGSLFLPAPSKRVTHKRYAPFVFTLGARQPTLYKRPDSDLKTSRESRAIVAPFLSTTIDAVTRRW
jgi:hypothetical protein